MKLRNKKTGEVVDRIWWDAEVDKVCIDGECMNFYCSLAELNEEWEDYEEPKELEGYSIDTFGDILPTNNRHNVDLRRLIQIGNTFETEEEAEKAVLKLRAWKRLKDKGFRFVCYERRSDWAMLPEVKALKNFIDITAYLPKDKIEEMKADLDFLFGGEE